MAESTGYILAPVLSAKRITDRVGYITELYMSDTKEPKVFEGFELAVLNSISTTGESKGAKIGVIATLDMGLPDKSGIVTVNNVVTPRKTPLEITWKKANNLT